MDLYSNNSKISPYCDQVVPFIQNRQSMALGNNLKSSEISNQKKNEYQEVIENQLMEVEQPSEDNDILSKIAESTQLLCVFESGGEQYAIPMNYVKEVVKMPVRTPIPQMPNYFSEMANVRGEVYGILDLSLFFQSNDVISPWNYLLILKDDKFRVGIALENVPNTVKVSTKMIEEISSSSFGSLKGKKYLTGIVKREKEMIILFDIKGMIGSEKFTEVL